MTKQKTQKETKHQCGCITTEHEGEIIFIDMCKRDLLNFCRDWRQKWKL